MKIKFWILAGFILVTQASLSYADIYVIYNNETGEVYTISEKDDTVIPEGYSKEVLQGGFSNYDFQYNPTYYKFKSKKFIVNTKKISDEEKIKQEMIEKENKKKQDKIKAKEKLKGLGLNEDEINAIAN